MARSASTAEPARAPVVVLDPVMVATSGAKLLADDALEALRTRLLPMADLVTPNIPEAELLIGRRIADGDDARAAIALLRGMGARAVLLKGGHVPGDEVRDLLLTPQGRQEYRGPRIASTSTHGTGCTLASAIATGLAQKLELHAAVARAHEYVRQAILTAPGFGHGNGPLNHAHTVKS